MMGVARLLVHCFFPFIAQRRSLTCRHLFGENAVACFAFCAF